MFLKILVITVDNQIMFRRYGQQPAISKSMPYDIASIMHLDAYAFSKNGRKTLASKQNDVLHPVKDKVSLSGYDVAKIRMMYECV